MYIYTSEYVYIYIYKNSGVYPINRLGCATRLVGIYKEDSHPRTFTNASPKDNMFVHLMKQIAVHKYI